MTPFEAEMEAEHRWPGCSATAKRVGEWFVIALKPAAGEPQAAAGVEDRVGRSREGFRGALEALGQRS
jgi:hypothetical protein